MKYLIDWSQHPAEGEVIQRCHGDEIGVTIATAITTTQRRHLGNRRLRISCWIATSAPTSVNYAIIVQLCKSNHRIHSRLIELITKNSRRSSFLRRMKELHMRIFDIFHENLKFTLKFTQWLAVTSPANQRHWRRNRSQKKIRLETKNSAQMLRILATRWRRADGQLPTDAAFVSRLEAHVEFVFFKRSLVNVG